jgi:hypothetical protein
MKRFTSFLLISCVTFRLAIGQDKGKERAAEKEAAITGEVVDVSCYLHLGAKGEGHQDCAVACAKAGGALGILTADGKLYVSTLPDDHKAGPNALLMDHISHTVTAKGMVRSKGGVNGIMIRSVEMAKMEKPQPMEKKY